jgi:hypothetical protein
MVTSSEGRRELPEAPLSSALYQARIGRVLSVNRLIAAASARCPDRATNRPASRDTRVLSSFVGSAVKKTKRLALQSLGPSGAPADAAIVEMRLRTN